MQISSRRETLKIMRLTKEQINIDEIGISEIRPRRARCISSKNTRRNGKSDQSEYTHRQTERGAGQRKCLDLFKLEKTVEFRIKNIENAIMPEKLAEYVAKKGSKSFEMKMDPINKTPNDLSTVWVKCSLIAANRETKALRFKIKWTMMRVEFLPNRAL